MSVLIAKFQNTPDVSAVMQTITTIQSAWFFDHHDLSNNNEIPAVELKKEIDGIGDKLAIFLHNEEGLSIPCEAEEVQRFCKDVCFNDI